jgi:hypothetical protein
MSAIGPKQTSAVAPHMSAFGGKADVRLLPITVFIGGNLGFNIAIDPLESRRLFFRRGKALIRKKSAQEIE